MKDKNTEKHVLEFQSSGGLRGWRTGQSPGASLLQGPRATTQANFKKCRFFNYIFFIQNFLP